LKNHFLVKCVIYQHTFVASFIGQAIAAYANVVLFFSGKKFVETWFPCDEVDYAYATILGGLTLGNGLGIIISTSVIPETSIVLNFDDLGKFIKKFNN
jgi:hypothetical protein